MVNNLPQFELLTRLLADFKLHRSRVVSCETSNFIYGEALRHGIDVSELAWLSEWGRR
jgi:hypothetical protein